MRSFALVGVVGSLLTALALADDGIQPELLAKIKGATVYVKVSAGGESGTGSGFVIKTEGDSVYVVTNHHVIEPKVIQIVGGMGRGPSFPRHGPMLGPPGPVGPPFGLTPRVIVQTLKNAKATVVLYSGTPKEDPRPAQVLAADPELDLAVLKASGVKELPQPIGLAHTPKLSETLPVFVFGFPFGEVLATGKGNPAITVGKGSISSLRLDDHGELALVQIDGALNPGNSGGPVVDARGELVGVAVATIRDSSGIGLAIPPQHLSRVLQGRVGKAELRASQDEEGVVTIHVEANLIDPLGKIKAATLNYMAASAVPENIKPSDLLSALPGCRKLALKIDGRLATGEMRLKKGATQVAVRYQVAGINDLNQESHTDSVFETVRPKVAAMMPDRVAPAAPSGAPGGGGSPPPQPRMQPTTPSRSAAVRQGPETDILGGSGNTFQDLAPQGGVLVGFEVGLGKFGRNDIVAAIRPVFQSAQGEETLGKQHGANTTRVVRVKAKPGYAVGGITGKAGMSIDGFSVTFMKLGKGVLDPKDVYQSEWIGGPGGFREVKLGGDGSLVTGIIGRENARGCTGLGLFMNLPAAKPEPPASANETPPADTADAAPSKPRPSAPSHRPASPSGNRFAGADSVTEFIGNFAGRRFEDAAPEGGTLVGLQVGLGTFGTERIINAVQPIFQTAEGKEVLGKQHGEFSGRTVTMKAKQGYAVGAIRGVTSGAMVGGLAVTFMKLGKDALDPKDAYESKWAGGTFGLEKTISGGGVLVLGIVGIEGRVGAEKDGCSGFALLLNGPSAATQSPPVLRSGSMPPAAAAAGNTNQYTPKSGKFTITMPPGQRSFQGSRSLNVRGIQLSLELSARSSEGVTFIAQTIGLGGQALRAVPQNERLQLFREALAAECQGSIVGETAIKQGARKGREFRIDGRGEFSRAQMYVSGGDVMCAIVTGDTKEDLTSKKAEDFFASFKLTEGEKD